MKHLTVGSVFGLILLSSIAARGASYSDIVQADGPIAYYRFNDTLPVATNSGSLGATADGSYQGTAAPGDTAPRPPDFQGFEPDNTALQLDGSTAFVTTLSGLLNDKPKFTLSGWFRRGGDQANRTGLFGQNDLVEFGYIDNNTIQCWTDNGLNVTPNPIPNGDWAHVALVSDGSPGTVTIYTNGVAAVSRTHTLPVNNTFPFNIGGGGVFDATGNFFLGQIDEVAVYDKPLSAAQIARQYFSVVQTAPRIVAQPQSTNLFEGASLILSVTAVGTPNLTYQWQVFGSDISGQTNSVLIISNATPSDSGSYSVTVKNDISDVTSDSVDVTVMETVPPVINADPQTATRYAGLPLTLQVSATGGSHLQYQWFRNGSGILDSTNSAISFPSLTTANQGDYYVIVSNSIASVTSLVATVTVLVPTPGSYEATVVAGGPMAYWRLGEASGTVAHDYAGGFDGTNSATVALGVAGALAGDSDTAAQFNGVDAFVGTPLSLNGAKQFTMQGWMQRSADQANRTGLWGQNDLIEFGYINNNTLECWTDNGLDITPNSIPNGEWAHVAVVCDGSPGTLTIYTNGAPAGSRTSTLPGDNAYKFNIGGGGIFDVTGNFFTGLIDEVAVYNRPLSALEICGLYQTGLGVKTIVQIVRGGNILPDTKPQGTPHPALNFGATWAAEEIDSNFTTRSGIMQFVAGGGNQITLAPDPDFNSPTGTITFWIRSTGTTGTGNSGAMLFDRRNGTLGDVIVQNDDGSIFVQARDATGIVNQFSAGNVNDGAWHHIAYAYDQSAAGFTTIYIDGIQAGTQVPTRSWAWDPAERIELGTSHDGYWRQFNGSLDDVRIYQRVLTEAEIGQIAGSDAVVDATTLVLRLNFDTAPVGTSILWSCGVLQSIPVFLPNANLGWTDVPNATSPYVIAPGAPTAFYRVRR